MNTFFQKPVSEWTDLERRAFNEVQEICKRHDGDAEARYGAWDAMVWLSSQPELKQPEFNWSPSKEQMVALKDVVETYRCRHNVSVGGDSTFMRIASLYNELKTL